MEQEMEQEKELFLPITGYLSIKPFQVYQGVQIDSLNRKYFSFQTFHASDNKNLFLNNAFNFSK